MGGSSLPVYRSTILSARAFQCDNRHNRGAILAVLDSRALRRHSSSFVKLYISRVNMVRQQEVRLGLALQFQRQVDEEDEQFEAHLTDFILSSAWSG